MAIVRERAARSVDRLFSLYFVFSKDQSNVKGRVKK